MNTTRTGRCRENKTKTRLSLSQYDELIAYLEPKANAMKPGTCTDQFSDKDSLTCNSLIRCLYGHRRNKRNGSRRRIRTDIQKNDTTEAKGNNAPHPGWGVKPVWETLHFITNRRNNLAMNRPENPVFERTCACMYNILKGRSPMKKKAFRKTKNKNLQ